MPLDIHPNSVGFFFVVRFRVKILVRLRIKVRVRFSAVEQQLGDKAAKLLLN